MQFQHKPHNKQQNKPHSHKKKGSVNRQFFNKSQALVIAQNKEARINYHKQIQDKKRQELFNKRRGMIDSTPSSVQGSAKVVAIIPLNQYADVKELQ